MEAATLAASPDRQSAMFIIDRGFDSDDVSLVDLIAGNEGDDDLILWASEAKVGDEYRTGGATGAQIVKRVS